MVQKRLYLGNVIADPITNCGDEKHPVYFLDGLPIRIETVASAEVADKVGTKTVGSETLPVYVKEGVPTPVTKVAAASKADEAGISASADRPTRRDLPTATDVDALFGDDHAGIYSSASSDGLSNLPDGVSGRFFLEVIPTSPTGTEQRVTESNGTLWYRHGEGGVWSDWTRSGGGSGSDTRPTQDASTIPATDDATSSSGKVVQVPPGTADSTIASVDFPALPFGLYSVVVRAKSSVVGGANEVFSIVTLAGSTQVSSHPVLESNFTAADTWTSLGVGVDFHGNTGDAMRVEIRRGTYAGTGTVAVDYVQVSPSPVALNALA